MVGGLGHEDEGHAVCLGRVDKRLLGVKIVAGDNDAEPGMRLSDFPKNPFASIDLAVLLGEPVAVLDGFREKWDHLAHVGMDDDSLKDLVMIAFLSLYVI